MERHANVSTDMTWYCRYNLGRDWLIGNATAQSSIITTSKLTNASTYSGQTSFNGYTYHTSVQYVSGLLQNASSGVNHFQTVGVNGTNAIDGLVAVMTVKITNQPSTTSRYACFYLRLEGDTSEREWVETRRGHDRFISISVMSSDGTATDFIYG